MQGWGSPSETEEALLGQASSERSHRLAAGKQHKAHARDTRPARRAGKDEAHARDTGPRREQVARAREARRALGGTVTGGALPGSALIARGRAAWPTPRCLCGSRAGAWTPRRPQLAQRTQPRPRVRSPASAPGPPLSTPGFRAAGIKGHGPRPRPLPRTGPQAET